MSDSTIFCFVPNYKSIGQSFTQTVHVIINRRDIYSSSSIIITNNGRNSGLK